MRHASTRTLVTGAGRGAWMTLAATACLVAIAACGSSSNPHATAGGGGVAQGIKFADCTRSHGMPSFPDPGDAGGGVELPQGSSPALEAAVGDCRALQPGGAGPSQATGQQKGMMLHLSRCMRARRQRLPRPGQLASVKPGRLELGISVSAGRSSRSPTRSTRSRPRSSRAPRCASSREPRLHHRFG